MKFQRRQRAESRGTGPSFSQDLLRGSIRHQNLVVHRDLKPGNILVTADGEPKLLDFGIAKLLAADDTTIEVTLADQKRLTPGYASPEQVRGEPITTLSDVYSLGALLYELLTGKNAHRFSVPHPPPTELFRVITQEEPIRPSAAVADPSIRRWLRADLDNIILKALQKEPSRRYSGVGALAADLQPFNNLGSLRGLHQRLAELFLGIGDGDAALEHAREELRINEQMRATQPTNNNIRRSEGLTHYHLGKAREILATRAPADAREQWQQAQNEFRQSAAIYNELNTKKPLVGPDAAKLEEIGKELAECDNALNR